MKVVLQRVKRASVEISGEFDTEVVGSIADGFVLLLGITHADTEKEADWLVNKILNLKLFAKDGSESFMDSSIEDVGGAILIVSQFTLYGDTRKGTKPSFSEAARPEQATKLYDYFVNKMIESGLHIETGRFGAHMEVDLVNDGPITLILDTDKKNL